MHISLTLWLLIPSYKFYHMNLIYATWIYRLNMIPLESIVLK
jgi:hypothetical protein